MWERCRSNGAVAGARRQVRALDHLHDVGEVPVRMLLAGLDVVLGGGDAGALDLLEGDGGARLQRSDGVDDGGLFRSGVRQRAHGHIAADPGKRVQINDESHDSQTSGLWGRPPGLRPTSTSAF
jgi:hypothetical protein